MTTAFTVKIESASDLDQLKMMAVNRGKRFFGDTPFEITGIEASQQATHGYNGRITLTASDLAGDGDAGRQQNFEGYGSTPQEVEDDIIRQAREFFGPDATLKIGRGYTFSSSASVGKPLRATVTVAMVEPGSVIVRPAVPAAEGQKKA